MIAVRLEGRLGNQIFQYAFIYATAKRLGVNFYIDQRAETFVVNKYFEIPLVRFEFLQKNIFSIKGFKNIFSHHLRTKFYDILRTVYGSRTVEFTNTDAPALQMIKCRDKAIYLGYFQSETYFDGYQKELLKLLTIKQCYQQEYAKVISTIPKNKKIAVIHDRRGDYIIRGWNLPASYYHQVISMVDDKDVQFVFISDDPEHIATEYAYLENKHVSFNSEIVDLQLLINADICILSCSSFSWWGAWLNQRVDKQVYAPKDWIGFADQKEFPLGISEHLNYNWIKV